MNFLFLLTEDDNDDLFFEACAERITGQSFQQVEPRRIRTGGGINEVVKKLPAFLNDLKGAAGYENAFFIIAIDNDRAPAHPGHERISGLGKFDSQKSCRTCQITTALEEHLGPDRDKWPAQGAIAIPVEMLESWLLYGIDPEQSELPIFSKKSSQSAKNFYHGNPPPQLKDLVSRERRSRGLSQSELFLEIAGEMNLDEISRMSLSFAQFRDEVSSWEFC